LISFFKTLLENKDANATTIELLAFGFSSVILRSPPGRAQFQMKEDELSKIEFLKYFIKENWLNDIQFRKE